MMISSRDNTYYRETYRENLVETKRMVIRQLLMEPLAGFLKMV